MKQYFIFLVALLALLLLFGCTQETKEVACTMDAKICPDGSYVGRVGPNCEFAPCLDNSESNVQIANPASTNCIDKNGNLEIVDTNEGQIGMCTLPSGKVCEEWALFRGECS